MAHIRPLNGFSAAPPLSSSQSSRRGSIFLGSHYVLSRWSKNVEHPPHPSHHQEDRPAQPLARLGHIVSPSPFVVGEVRNAHHSTNGLIYVAYSTLVAAGISLECPDSMERRLLQFITSPWRPSTPCSLPSPHTASLTLNLPDTSIVSKIRMINRAFLTSRRAEIGSAQLSALMRPTMSGLLLGPCAITGTGYRTFGSLRESFVLRMGLSHVS